ncbi:hypothetical protein BAE44_0021359 [Dichanthelium oligosanthes]|uniref:DUF4408 domain-containing protein n=1 Tax=Dichanthelium oligosanthes TaxID=888268 RepID=A0A1E5UXN3_9POAL|nr:hypothetical protein BAE44_0021359 [Dichanthelium oligosanthes]
MAAAGAALRLRLLYRMLRVGELLALVAFLSWSSSRVPSAAAAVLRLAGSLLLNARFVFVLGNAIVLLLLALSRHDLSASSNSNQTSTASAAATSAHPQAAPAAAASAGFSSFATPAPTPSSTLLEEAASSFVAPAPPPATVEAPEAVAAAPASERAARAAAVAFEDKPAVRVSKLARAPRRSRSEKMGPRLASRAVSPELRRSESENGRRRRSSVTARDAQACWGMDDADEFRRTVEAFIAKQTRFHREESMTMAVVAGGAAGGHCGAAPAFTGALAVVE